MSLHKKAQEGGRLLQNEDIKGEILEIVYFRTDNITKMKSQGMTSLLEP